MQGHDSKRQWGIGQRPRALAAAVALAALLAPSGAGRAAAEPEASSEPSPLAAPGEQLYVRHCAVCHARTGRGNGPFAGILRVAPADLTLLAARNGGTFPEDRVASHIDGRFEVPAHGPREMPVWGRRLGTPTAAGVGADEAARGEILALTTYLKALQRSE